MIELKENQIIQTKNESNYVIRHILAKQHGVIAVREDSYEFFIDFYEFKIIKDVEGL